jgi:hypothetical protein
MKKPERMYNKMADTRNKKRHNKANGWADCNEGVSKLGVTPKSYYLSKYPCKSCMRVLHLTFVGPQLLQYIPDSASFGLDAICSTVRFVGVRTTGALALEGALFFPEGCGADTEGSSGSIVWTSGFVLMMVRGVNLVIRLGSAPASRRLCQASHNNAFNERSGSTIGVDPTPGQLIWFTGQEHSALNRGRPQFSSNSRSTQFQLRGTVVAFHHANRVSTALTVTVARDNTI